MKTQLCVCCALPWLYSCGSRPTVAPSGGLPQSSVLARDQGEGEGMADCPQPAGGRSPTWGGGGGGGAHQATRREQKSGDDVHRFGCKDVAAQDHIRLTESTCQGHSVFLLLLIFIYR